MVISGGIVTLEPAAVSRLLALGTGGQCGDTHGLLGNLLAVESGSNGRSWSSASEHLDETELERMSDDGSVPKVSPVLNQNLIASDCKINYNLVF